MKLLLVATGGTIASQDMGSGLEPSISPEALIQFVPEISKYCHLDTASVINIDSMNVCPNDWLKITNTIRDNYDKYDGFVVAHGTDTLGYTAAALSYLIQNSPKPIIITGAQKPVDEENSDAIQNLLDSVKIAASGLPGVHVVFGSKIIKGTRAKKVKTKGFEAFESVNYPYVGFTNHFTYEGSPIQIEKPVFTRELEQDVCILKLTPGMKTDVLKYMAQRYKGIVIESYGAGGLPVNERSNFLSCLDYVLGKGVVIAIGTQVIYEGTDMFVTEIGRRVFQYENVLQTLDMNIETAAVKLMYLLGNKNNLNPIKRKFYETIWDDMLLQDRLCR